MQLETRTLWLKVASAVVIVSGLLTALTALPGLSAPMTFMGDLIFWPLDGGQDATAPTSRLLLAIAGGLTTGFGVLFWLISTRLHPTDPHLARTLILAGIGSWFVVDSAGSIAAGAPLNVLFNLIFLEMFAIPLWRRPAETGPMASSSLKAEA